MSDVNGIPNYGFQGGQTGGPIGGIPNQTPAWSADQINRGMYGSYHPAMAQAILNQGFNQFGQQTDHYSALSAAYGRNVGPSMPAGTYPSTGGYPSTDGMDPGMSQWQADVAARYGTAYPSGEVTRGPDLPAPNNWGPYFDQMSGYQQGADPALADRTMYNQYDPASYSAGTPWGGPAQPNPYAQLGYDPNAPFGGGFQNMHRGTFDPATYNGDGGTSFAPSYDPAGSNQRHADYMRQYGLSLPGGSSDPFSQFNQGGEQPGGSQFVEPSPSGTPWWMQGTDPNMMAARDLLKQGTGWTAGVQQVGQDPSLAQNINQSIWDVGQASRPEMFIGREPWRTAGENGTLGYMSGTGGYYSEFAPPPGQDASRFDTSGFYGAQPMPGASQGMGPGYGGFNNGPQANQFENRFGGWGTDPGSPSMYYTGQGFRGQNTGQLYGPSQLPPGFAPSYSLENPNGIAQRPYIGGPMFDMGNGGV
jgi:hypothetical protein